MTNGPSAPSGPPPAPREIQHVTEALYKQNLELAERNKTLLLLRKIDELVLGSGGNVQEVAAQISRIIIKETDFSMVAIYVSNKKQSELLPYALTTRSGLDRVEKGILKELFNQKIALRRHDSVISHSNRTRKIKIARDLDQLFEHDLGMESKTLLQKDAGIRNWFVCPLGARWQSIGTMIIGIPVIAKNLSPYRRTLVERLSSAVGVAIDNRLLYEEIQEATARLRSANKRLRELDEAKDEFISMASHQLRTPLTSIKGYLSMLNEGDAGPLNHQQAEFADLAYTSAQRMVYLIADMLNVSRISTGKLVVDKSLFDLDKVIEEEIAQLERTAQARGVAIKYQPPASLLGAINLDEGKTRQVVMNFLDNAMYYAPNSTVEVRLEIVGDSLRFTVKDHGIGVPEKEKANLFKKFYRAPNAKRARPDGTGLGLYMAKMVVEMQGGKIIFNSQVGKGSTFGFEFPTGLLAKAPTKTIRPIGSKLTHSRSNAASAS